MTSYEKILRLFFAEHNPCAEAWSRQYRSLLLVGSDEQLETARRIAKEVAEARGKPVKTEIARLDRFYRAEDYHQKYELRRHPKLLAEMKRYYPKAADLTDSTAAARLNAWLGGHATKEQVEKEIGSLGLTEDGERRLRKLLRIRR